VLLLSAGWRAAETQNLQCLPQAQGHAWCHGLLWPLLLLPPPRGDRSAQATLQQRLGGPLASEQEVHLAALSTVSRCRKEQP